MGQAMIRLLRGLLGRGGEETAGTCSLFDLYWKMAKAMLRFLRRFLGGRARKPLPPTTTTGPLHHYIDREKEQQVVVESASVSAAQIGSVSEAEASSAGGQVVGKLSAPEQPKLRQYSADQRIEASGGQAVENLSAPYNLGGFAEFLKENYKRAESNILALSSRGCKLVMAWGGRYHNGHQPPSIALSQIQLHPLQLPPRCLL